MKLTRGASDPHVQVSADPADHFDVDWYLRTNDDVRAAGLEPFEHYRFFGWKEGRDPAPWFSTTWYISQTFAPVGMTPVEPLQHYLDHGQFGSFTPNEMVEHKLQQDAKPLFDVDYYLRSNPDIAAADVDAWAHFLDIGWREGRNPSAAFDISFYAETHMNPGLPPRNGLLHYVRIGREIGLPTAPGPAAPQRLFSRSLEALTTWIEDRETVLGTSESLFHSILFDPIYYAHVAGREGDKQALINDFLARAPRDCPNPSDRFSCAFYLAAYGDLIGSDENPLAHYLREGHRSGFYPNAVAALADAKLITAQGQISTQHYRMALKLDLEHPPVLDYLLNGQHCDARLDPNINDTFIKQIYGLLVGDIGAPLAFFLRHKHLPWVFGSPEHLRRVAADIRSCAYFDTSYYVAQAGIEGTGIDPAEHYAIIGVREGTACHPDFDPDFYVTTYPDLANVPVVPLLHYATDGRNEGRLGHSHVPQGRRPGRIEFDADRETVLLFSHEASRSGAPIVALNIARVLAKTYNVVCWLGSEGPLSDAFEETAIDIVTGWSGSDATAAQIRHLRQDYGCAFALVNSVVCHPVLPALRLEHVPVVSLIHEFANYVFPLGATSRMAMSSDVTILPADIVRDAVLTELAKIGAGTRPQNLVVRPQGYNTAGAQHGLINEQDILDYIRCDRTNPRSRVLFGAGYVQTRKGLDLFLQAARHLMDDPDHDWRFVWVGANYAPETDMVTSVYLEQQIISAGLSSHFTYFDEQPTLEPFWSVADVFFLSSRLDPYPNVALDALARDVPVVCFGGGTGVAALQDDYPWAVRASPFADVKSAAEICADFARKIDDVRATFQSGTGKALMAALSFDAYVRDILDHAETAKANAARVDTIEAGLGDLGAAELRRALAFVPSAFRFRAPARSEYQRRTLAECLYPGRLDPGLIYTDANHLHPRPAFDVGYAAASFLSWSADYGSLKGMAADGDNRHLVHLHVLNPDTLRLLLQTDSGVGELARHVQFTVTAPNPSILAALREMNEPGLEIADRPTLDPLQFLRTLSASSDRRYITYAELDFIRADAFRPILRSGDRTLFRMLYSGAIDACLTETGVSAVLCNPCLGERSLNAEAQAGTRHPRYAPRFAGTYDRQVLSRFFEDRRGELAEKTSRVSNVDAGSMAAIVFAEYLMDQPGLTATILPPSDI